MKLGFVDLKHPKYGFANRDQTGGFGSQMQAAGAIGKLLQKVKKNKSRLPVLALGNLAQLGENLITRSIILKVHSDGHRSIDCC